MGLLRSRRKQKLTPDPFPSITMNSRVQLKPGKTVERSGIYRSSKTEQNTLLVRGQPAPPTAAKGEKWHLIVDPHPDR